MDMLLISENKIKISLTRTDLDGYSITCDGIDYDNTETRRVFWSLLDDAKHKTGFDAAGSRIFVQIYPDKDGGCELYVSKLKKPDGCGNVTFTPCDNVKDTSYFSFDSVKTLISACRSLRNMGFSGVSDAFSDGDDKFYLRLRGGGKMADLLGEYGEKRTSSGIGTYIAEHCRTVRLGDAVEKLSVL